MSNKIKHLEFIQAVINRMASNSFLLKGWNVTLVVGLLALTLKDTVVDYIFVAFIPILVFWILDAFFLSRERAYRELYNMVRIVENDNNIDFSMSVKEFRKGRNNWIHSFFSSTLFIFYMSMIILLLIIQYIIIKVSLLHQCGN